MIARHIGTADHGALGNNCNPRVRLARHRRAALRGEHRPAVSWLSESATCLADHLLGSLAASHAEHDEQRTQQE
ncbi:hypothetical protein ACI1US_01500 [Leucobacter sp. BZR 635]